MSLSEEAVSKSATALFEAERTRTQIGLITKANPGMTMDDAYAIQSALVKKKLESGRKIKGWKIGLTSKAMQDALKIHIPDSGILFDNMFFNDGSDIPKDRFIQTRVEAEIAFVLGKDLNGESITRDDVLAATDHIAPALEILDTRIVRTDPETGELRKIFDTISDNAANAGIVLGNQQHLPESLDMRWIGSIVSRNDEVEETGLGAGVLNDPPMGIVWLVERLARYGQGLSAGDVVLSGSFIRPVEARHGDRFFADYGSFGRVSCHFQ